MIDRLLKEDKEDKVVDADTDWCFKQLPERQVKFEFDVTGMWNDAVNRAFYSTHGTEEQKKLFLREEHPTMGVMALPLLGATEFIEWKGQRYLKSIRTGKYMGRYTPPKTRVGGTPTDAEALGYNDKILPPDLERFGIYFPGAKGYSKE